MPAPRCRDCDQPIGFVECADPDGKIWLNKFDSAPEAVERSDRGWVLRVTLKRHDCPAKQRGGGEQARIAALEARIRELEGVAPPRPADDTEDPF